MKKGYVKLHREITDHWLWNEKPFSKAQAWIDILMMVNHETAKFPLGKELVEVERGSCITSILKLSDKWGWSRHKVDDFFTLLEKEQMLGIKKDNKKTTLTVCNYSIYQSKEEEKGHQKDIKRTSKGHQKDTNKNEKNEKECKRNIYSDYSSNPKLQQTIKEFIEMRKQKKKPMTDKAIQMLLNKLGKIEDADEKKIIILENSIINSWTDIYPLKGNETRKVAEF
jgi:DNA replication protein DnaD